MKILHYYGTIINLNELISSSIECKMKGENRKLVIAKLNETLSFALKIY